MQTKTPHEIYELCGRIARGVYAKDPPAEYYAARVTRLLFGTASHEGRGFQARRQEGSGRKPFSRDKIVGAWSYWGLEHIAVQEVLNQLARRKELERRVDGVIAPTGWNVARIRGIEPLQRMQLMMDDDLIACAFCRLYYLFRPGQIPEGVAEQARYWKREYNTKKGSGTVPKWIEHWYGWAEPVIKEMEETDV